MKKRTLFLVILAVALVHVGVFLLLKDSKPLPKRKHVPRPNFTMRESQVTLPGTDERVTFREYTVSTRLTPRPILE
jgi:hypothetical protein